MQNVETTVALRSSFSSLHSSFIRHASLGTAALVVLISLSGAHPAAAGVLPYSPALARVYDAILDARFDDAEAETVRACGPAPPQACELLRATALWWRIQLDPGNTSRDAQVRAKIDAVIASMEQWTSREPNRADAWFFLGGAYGLRVQFRVLRAERLSAALDGKRIKNALERSLALDANLQDAWFGIGLYHYYADIAPTALKMLRWMLALPGGNKVEGLREMLRARDRGELLRGEADFQLHVIYLWYEQDYEEALRLLEGLRAAYPHNPLFLQSIAEVQHVYRHDLPASLEAWRALFALARQRRVALPEMSEARARLGMATELDALGETDSAIEQLRALAEAKPTAPYGIAALAHYRLGAAYDRMGLRGAGRRRLPGRRGRGAARRPRRGALEGTRRTAPPAGRANRRGLPLVARRAAAPAAPRVDRRRPTSWRGRPRSLPRIPTPCTARRCCWSRANDARRRSSRSNGSSRCGRSPRRRCLRRRATRPRACSRQSGQRERAIEMYRRASARARRRGGGPRRLREVARPPPRPGRRAVTANATTAHTATTATRPDGHGRRTPCADHDLHHQGSQGPRGTHARRRSRHHRCVRRHVEIGGGA